MAEHQLNSRSSRSHCVYTFHLTKTFGDSRGNDELKEKVEAEVMQSKLNLVDLAGSERIEKTGSTGTRVFPII